MVTGMQVKAISMKVEELMESLYAGWREDADSLCKLLADACPQWHHLGDQLLTDKAEVATVEHAMLNNSKFGSIAPATEHLEALLQSCREVAEDKLGAIVPADVWKNCADTAKLARDTTCATYALYHLRVVFPKLKGNKHKAAQAKKLKQDLAEKGARVPLPLEKATDQVVAGEAH